MVSQGSQSLALGLAKTAAPQLDEFVCLALQGFVDQAASLTILFSSRTNQ
jgi:hypothetical protein